MRITSFIPALAASSALLAGAGTALAGEPVVEPVIQDTIPVAVMPNAATAWAGPYAGVSLGYSALADDEIGLELDDGDRETALGQVDVEGFTGAAHLGYRWQRGPWVLGPELGIEGGSVDASDDVAAFGETATIESDVNYIVTLLMKTGYEVSPGTLVYGSAGVAHGDFDYTGTSDGTSQTIGYSRTGYILGLGVERAVSDRMAVFAEYQYREFGKESIFFDLDDGGTAETQATPSHSNIKVGVNFKF